MHPRLLPLISLAVVTPLGFGLKLVRFGPPPRGPITAYLNNSAAGALYEVFWCLVFFFIFPRRRAIVPICIGVFLATSALEFLQLWHPTPPHLLTTLRSSFLGKTLLGTTFSWPDIPHYAAGCVMAYFWLRAIGPRGVEQKTPGKQAPGA